MFNRKVSLLIMAACLAGLVGCESARVLPWQRGDLAKREMGWEPDPMVSSYREHVYTSKEGASGGLGTGGGGCGCY